MNNEVGPIAGLSNYPSNVALEQLFPELTRMVGPIDPFEVPSACRRAVMQNAATWEAIRLTSIGQIMNWDMVGAGRIVKIINFCRERASELQGGAAPVPIPIAGDALTTALGVLGAWATYVGADDDLGNCLAIAATTHVPPSVSDAAAFVDSLPLKTYTAEQQVSRFDHGTQARLLLEQFDEREQEILERILTKGIRPRKTLEEIGDQFGVTREAIRRQQERVEERFRELVYSADFEMVRFRADVIRRRCGTALPLDDAPPEVIPADNDSLVDEVFAFLAGPYRVSHNWIYLEEFGESPFVLVDEAFDHTATEFVAPLDAMIDDLEGRGVLPRAAHQLLAEYQGVRVFGSEVLRWTKHEERVGGALQHVGRPLTIDEIVDFVGMPDKVRPISNHLAEAPYANRVGVQRWALKTWGLDSYASIVEHMRLTLNAGPTVLSELAERMHDQFGVSPNSVKMYASMHPTFILERGVVRLRGADEPYIPDTHLDQTENCFVLDGEWTYRIQVDRDVLRGSGRTIPEPFAVHLGLRPNSSASRRCNGHDIALSWTGMAPAIGSLRWFAQQEELTDGDYIFVRSNGIDSLDLRRVRRSVLENSSPEEQVLRLLGLPVELTGEERSTLQSLLFEPSSGEVADDRTQESSISAIEAMVAQSLGFQRTRAVTRGELRAALQRHDSSIIPTAPR